MTDLLTPAAVPSLAQNARAVLGKRNLVFVGLMRAGKSVIGRMVAQNLSVPFIDTDAEIEGVSRLTIAELFAAYGETEFRALEARVNGRLLQSSEEHPSELLTNAQLVCR